MRKLTGDLLALAKEGHFDVIVQGCNCYCTMGAGIAAQIAKQYPQALEADKRTEPGDPKKLGSYTQADSGEGFVIVNAYTQFGFANDKNPLALDYKALVLAFKAINAEFAGKRIGIPMIGAGLAGGHWQAIELLIDSVIDKADITLVQFPTGVNIFSGSNALNGLAAALTNPTEMAVSKGMLSKHYPIEARGVSYQSVELAYQALKGLVDDSPESRDSLMVELIAQKFRQHQDLALAVQEQGGSLWLKLCTHYTGAKSERFQAWEGTGLKSRFIRNLVKGFELSQTNQELTKLSNNDNQGLLF